MNMFVCVCGGGIYTVGRISIMREDMTLDNDFIIIFRLSF